MYSTSGFLQIHTINPIKKQDKQKERITLVMDSASCALTVAEKSVSSGVLHIGTSILSDINEKHRTRSQDEKMIRSCAGLTGSAMAFSSNPYIGTAIGVGLAVSEYGEMHMRMETEANKRLYSDLKKAGVSDDMIRDIIYDRCCGIP